jgi:hypothetical protein
MQQGGANNMVTRSSLLQSADPFLPIPDKTWLYKSRQYMLCIGGGSDKVKVLLELGMKSVNFGLTLKNNFFYS